MLAVLLSAVTREPYLAVVSVPVVVFVILARLTSRRPHTQLTVERLSDDERLYEEDGRTYSVFVRNDGGGLDMVEVVDVLPAGVKLKSGSNRAYASLRSGEEAEVRYSLASPSFGIFSVGPVKVRTLDGFGLFAEERTFEDRARLVVLPKISFVEHLRLGLRLTKNWPGEIASRRTGAGTEFYSVRPHIPVDLPKNINWRATARSDGLQTNQYMSELGGEVMIVLDARSSTQLGSPPRTLLSYSVRASAALAYGLLRDRDRVGLLVVGSSLVKVQPGFGRRQFDRILYALVGVEGGSIWEMKHLPQYLRLLYPRVNQLVVLSPLVEESVYSSLMELAAGGYSLTLVSPSPFDLERETLEKGRVTSVAEGLARLQRRARLSTLSRYVAVVDWDVSQPLSESLAEGMSVWRKGGTR